MSSGLHIGIDDEKIVVSPRPLRTSAGRARHHRAGLVTEVVPVGAEGRTQEERTAFAARLSLPLIFACASLYAADLPWWPAFAGAAGAVAAVWRRQARQAGPGRFAIPSGDGIRVLWSAPERTAYRRAVLVARRVRRTWPALAPMIDPAEADRALTSALDDLATIMVRRQKLRRLKEDLFSVRAEAAPTSNVRVPPEKKRAVPAGAATVPSSAVPVTPEALVTRWTGACSGAGAAQPDDETAPVDDSPALRALDEQIARIERVLLESAGQANRILRSLGAAAVAGEAFAREMRVAESVRDAEVVLAGLADGAAPVGDSGPELADRTAAVISAYRALAGADRH